MIIGKKTPPALADRQFVGQPQGTLAQPFDEVGGDPIAQASLDEAVGEEEGDDDEPDDLVGEGREGAGEGQGFSDDRSGEAKEGPGSDEQGAEDEAGDGGMVNLWKRRRGWGGRRGLKLRESFGNGLKIEEEERGERLRRELFFIIKIMGCEVTVLPNQKTRF